MKYAEQIDKDNEEIRGIFTKLYSGKQENQ